MTSLLHPWSGTCIQNEPIGDSCKNKVQRKSFRYSNQNKFLKITIVEAPERVTNENTNTDTRLQITLYKKDSYIEKVRSLVLFG